MLLSSPLSSSFASCRLSIAALVVEFALGRLILLSNRCHRIPSALWSSCRCCFVVVSQSVVLLWRSRVLSVYHPSPTAVAVDFALGRFILHRDVKLFSSLVVVILLWHSGALSVCHLPLAVVAVEFASGRFVLLSNCHSCVRLALLSCRVIWSFCRRCFVVAFRRSVYVNVS